MADGTLATFVAGDGYCWQYRRFDPPGESRAHLVCLHGIQSHGGWYTHSCLWLANAGFTVSFLDRRGAGLNHTARGDAPSFRRLLDDIAEYLHSIRGPETDAALGFGMPAVRSPLPVFLLAISWGGKLGVALQKRHPNLVDGLVLLSPGLFPQVAPPFWRRWAIFGSRLVAPATRYPIPLNDPELFTASPHWQQFIRDDPLALHDATARLLIESVRLDIYLRRCPAAVTVPVLLLLAEHDRIIVNPATRQYVERCATADRQIIEYAGAHHTLEFEPEPERWLANLRQWLEKRIPARLDPPGAPP